MQTSLPLLLELDRPRVTRRRLDDRGSYAFGVLLPDGTIAGHCTVHPVAVGAAEMISTPPRQRQRRQPEIEAAWRRCLMETTTYHRVIEIVGPLRNAADAPRKARP